jgi:hypothetical protein
MLNSACLFHRKNNQQLKVRMQFVGLFPKSIGEISNVYFTEITPAGWTFSIWGLIYAWQVSDQVFIQLTFSLTEFFPNQPFFEIVDAHAV